MALIVPVDVEVKEKRKKKKDANYPDRTGDLQMDREVFSLALSQLS